MTSAIDIATERVRSLHRYIPGRASTDALGKLSSNESPYGVSPLVRERLAGVADDVHRYENSQVVRARLANYLGVGEDRVVLTSGSDELCYLLAMIFLYPGQHKVVLSDPSYAIDVTVSTLAGAAIHRVPLLDGDHDLNGLATASRDARLLWIPTPHNPTGRAVRRRELEVFVREVSESCVIVIDEAYRSYVNPDEQADTIDLIRNHPNVVVQRTFSKDHALAGLRVGYGLADPAIAAALDAVRGPFNVNVAALGAVTAAIESDAWRDMGVDMIRRERQRLEDLFDTLGIEYFPSQANFVTVKISWPSVRDRLADVGISVRAGEELGLPGWCRISIGWPPHMAVLRKTLADWHLQERKLTW